MNSNDNNSSKTYHGLISPIEWESYLSAPQPTEIANNTPMIVYDPIVTNDQPAIITSCNTQVLVPTQIVSNGQPIGIILSISQTVGNSQPMKLILDKPQFIGNEQPMMITLGKAPQAHTTPLLGGKENQIVMPQAIKTILHVPQITTNLDNFDSTQDVQDWKREHDWESELKEWKREMKSTRPDELKAILKFLKLSPQLSIEDLIKFMSSNMLDSDATDKVWENVSTPEEYVQTMLMYLKGKLFSTLSHGGPLCSESFLVLPELYELTRLGCPTFNSQPFAVYEINGEICKAVPYVDFFCPNKFVYQIVEILIKTCHISMVIGDKHTIHMISPSQNITNTIPLHVNSEGEPVHGTAHGITTNMYNDMTNIMFGCHPSCGEAMFDTYTCMCICSTGLSNKFFADVIAAVKSAQAQD
uniref:Uncharacterized protein n=1 Tax=Pithovirus LCPAC201 TaxID=2506591 RepID=A0A481Z7M8_9VIRU|nr:MAG: hypothetical protein LCPAC201_00020 [Pithovirus LCPAC201]